jgi:hypothetical protein
MSKSDGHHKIHRISQNIFFSFVGSAITAKMKYSSTEITQLIWKWRVADG